jgi:hypothetical protein
MKYLEGYHQPPFKPCVSCGRLKVINAGDYCKDCAAKWRDDPEYFVVDPKSAADIHEISGIMVSYLMAKQERAFEDNCVYVIFYAGGKWKEVTVAERFHLPTVMKRLISRLESE